MKNLPNKLPKHVHVIGICGVATSALAIAFHKAGVVVTGSDKGFFPPVSTELEKAGVPFYAGWHPEKMIGGGLPDVCIVGTASGSANPETVFAKEKNIPLLSFAEAIGKFFVKERSVVCVGTWGKTSSSALLSHILIEAGFDPTYMFGGVSLSHEAAAYLGKSDVSVFEGDEYKSGPSDPTAKFFYYKPTHLLLTAVSWDHADLYPTEESYFDAFKKLVKGVPANGFIVANKDQAGVAKTLEEYKGKITSYGKSGDYSFEQVKQSETGLDFKIRYGKEISAVKSPMLGAFQAENITGCFAMASELGVPTEKIIAAIASFKGMRRRLEKRLDGETAKSGVTIFDDIAHSPEKAASTLKELRSIYDGKIIAIFEPNIGGREREAAAKYDDAFKDADMVIIPRLTKLKTSTEIEAPMEGEELAATISKTHANVHTIADDQKLVDILATTAKKGDTIVFLGSHGFRGMIEEAVKKLG
jgi:UDP-N-acetylmuramate: L-alanyl-gamma-D-glutamyl-meso-diaminopimelate ligase